MIRHFTVKVKCAFALLQHTNINVIRSIVVRRTFCLETRRGIQFIGTNVKNRTSIYKEINLHQCTLQQTLKFIVVNHCHHLSDLYVDLPDLHVDQQDLSKKKMLPKSFLHNVFLLPKNKTQINIISYFYSITAILYFIWFVIQMASLFHNLQIATWSYFQKRN